MTDTPVATDAAAEAPALDPADPRNFPHHYIVRKKDARRTRARSFHVDEKCPTIGTIAADSVLDDLSVEVVEYLGLKACVGCTGPEKPRDRNSGPIEMIGTAIKRIRQASTVVPTRPDSEQIAALVVAQLEHDGYRVTKARKGTLPDRADVDPITAWVEENTPFSEGEAEPDFEESERAAAVEPEPEPTDERGMVPNEPDEATDTDEPRTPPTGRNPEIAVVHEPVPPTL